MDLITGLPPSKRAQPAFTMLVSWLGTTTKKKWRYIFPSRRKSECHQDKSHKRRSRARWESCWYHIQYRHLKTQIFESYENKYIWLNFFIILTLCRNVLRRWLRKNSLELLISQTNSDALFRAFSVMYDHHDAESVFPWAIKFLVFSTSSKSLLLRDIPWIFRTM